MAAGKIFKRKQDEDEGGNFEQPERQHGHRVGDEELQQRRQHQRNGKDQQRGEIGGRQDVLPETENKNREWNTGHGDERNAPGKKQAEPIPQIIHRLKQELADVALADVGGDLPVVFIDRRQHVHHGDEQVIKHHFRLGKTGGSSRAVPVRVNGLPQRQHGEERDETEQRAREIVEAIRQIALQPDVDDVEIFFHAAAREI